MTENKKVSVLFVCLGNICRSPTAEGIFKHHVSVAGLAHVIESDSAGTGDYHIGRQPDPRACAAAARRGYDLSVFRARQVTKRDFAEFDYVLAMDDENLRALKRLCPRDHMHKLKLLGDFSSGAVRAVPDPYGGGPQDFDLVLYVLEDAAQRLLRHIRADLRL